MLVGHVCLPGQGVRAKVEVTEEQKEKVVRIGGSAIHALSYVDLLGSNITAAVPCKFAAQP